MNARKTNMMRYFSWEELTDRDHAQYNVSALLMSLFSKSSPVLVSFYSFNTGLFNLNPDCGRLLRPSFKDLGLRREV